MRYLRWLHSPSLWSSPSMFVLLNTLWMCSLFMMDCWLRCDECIGVPGCCHDSAAAQYIGEELPPNSILADAGYRGAGARFICSDGTREHATRRVPVEHKFASVKVNFRLVGSRYRRASAWHGPKVRISVGLDNMKLTFGGTMAMRYWTRIYCVWSLWNGQCVTGMLSIYFMCYLKSTLFVSRKLLCIYYDLIRRLCVFITFHLYHLHVVVQEFSLCLSRLPPSEWWSLFRLKFVCLFGVIFPLMNIVHLFESGYVCSLTCSDVSSWSDF